MRGTIPARLIYLPLVITSLMVIWTLCISPFSQYGDNWAVWPALLALPLIIIAHVALLFGMPNRLPLLIYASVHTAVAVPIWFVCLMRISKDAI
jgi:hypothetical protein